MSLTHQEFSQHINDHMVSLAQEHDVSIESAVGGVALSTLLLMEEAGIESIEIGNFTLSITEKPTTK